MRKTGSRCASQRGVSLIELLLALVIFTLLLGAAAAYSIDWMNQEKMRSAVYQVQTFLQRARLEAVSRNRSCRFTVNTATRKLQVLDMNNTSTTTDDVVLTSATIDSTVNFALPVSGSPVTLAVLSGTTYETSFASTGIVSSGIGFVSLSGGQTFRKVSVYGAGGVQVQKWDGSAWVTGA